MSESGNNNGLDVKKEKMSRREFFKLGGFGLVSSVLLFKDKKIFREEGRININSFLSAVEIEGKKEWALDFGRLKESFPELVHQTEDGSYSLINKSENSITLDFGRAFGKEIRFRKNLTDEVVSNISWEKSTMESSFHQVSAGLILEGPFEIKGSAFIPPTLRGDNLDSTILFKGSGIEKCVVEDVSFSGLNSFKKDSDGGGDCPSPAFISGNNVNLEVKGVKIEHSPLKPDDVDEGGSQLSKGILLHNTNNIKKLELNIEDSIIKGIQWDGIYSNGMVDIRINNSAIIQSDDYKYRRGAGVGSTYNGPEAKIIIHNSIINYTKGIVLVKEALQRAVDSDPKNLEHGVKITNSEIATPSWAVGFIGDQRVDLSEVLLKPNYGDPAKHDIFGSPLMLFYLSSKELRLSFDNLHFQIDESKERDVILMTLLNADDGEAFYEMEEVGLKEFFEKNIEHWGNVSMSSSSNENNLLATIRREDVFKFLDDISSDDKLSPASIQLLFDTKEMRFKMRFGKIGSAPGEFSYSDYYYITPKPKRERFRV